MLFQLNVGGISVSRYARLSPNSGLPLFFSTKKRQRNCAAEFHDGGYSRVHLKGAEQLLLASLLLWTTQSQPGNPAGAAQQKSSLSSKHNLIAAC